MNIFKELNTKSNSNSIEIREVSTGSKRFFSDEGFKAQQLKSPGARIYQGKHARDIAVELGISVRGVMYRIKKFGTPYPANIKAPRGRSGRSKKG